MLEGKISTNLVVFYKTKAKSVKAMIYSHLHLLENVLNCNCCPSKTIRVLMGDNLNLHRYSPLWTNPNKEEVVYLREFLLEKSYVQVDIRTIRIKLKNCKHFRGSCITCSYVVGQTLLKDTGSFLVLEA